MDSDAPIINWLLEISFIGHIGIGYWFVYILLAPMIIQYERKEWSTKESKGKLWQNHNESIGAAVFDEKARLGTKQHWLVKK